MNLLCSLWYGFSRAEISLPWPNDVRTGEHYRGRAAEAIRSMLVSLFPDNRHFWMHKPIGIPSIYWIMQKEKQFASFSEWFWSGMGYMFPSAQYFTILRDPRDVALSSISYFGVDEASAWRDLDVCYDILLHERCPVQHAVVYPNLVKNPEAELRQLFRFLNIEFDDICLEAFRYQWVESADQPGPDRLYRRLKQPDDRRETQLYSRRDKWNTLKLGKEAHNVLSKATRLWERFGVQLEGRDS